MCFTHVEKYRYNNNNAYVTAYLSYQQTNMYLEQEKDNTDREKSD